MESVSPIERVVCQPLVSLEEQHRLGVECQAWQVRIGRLQSRVEGKAPSRFLTAAIVIAKRRGAVSRNALVLSVMRWIAKRAQQYHKNPNGLTFDDLVSIGCLGAMRAAERWEPSRGVKYLTYADHWIRQMMHRYGGYAKAKQQLPVATDINPEVLADIVKDEGPNHIDAFHDGESVEADMAMVRQFFPKLTPLRQEVIRLRYLGGQWRPRGEVAEAMGKTRFAVKELEEQAVATLAENIRWARSGSSE